jgi:monofunctional biosynthetic peptidoglycan transglycosylase
MASTSARKGFGTMLLRLVLGVTLAILAGLALLIVTWRSLPPVSTLMLARSLSGESVARVYVPLERISSYLRDAVILSEDARFCRHGGVDWDAMREVIGQSEPSGPARGASTIAMQTVKNLFLWPSRSYFRKAVEIPLALVLDAVWPKRRMLEVYLNIAEWGDGIYGAEAAARHYFNKTADRLDPWDAALLAAALPNPHQREAARPTRRHATLARRILARLHAADPLLLACVH